MERAKKIKCILIIVVLAILIFTFIIINKLNKNKNQYDLPKGPTEAEPEEYSNGFVGINDFSMHDVVQEAVNSFLISQNPNEEAQGNHTNIIPFETRVKYGDNINMYLTHVGLIQNDSVQEKMYLVKLDRENQTFSVEQLSDDNMEINTIQVSEDNEKIEKNEHNQYIIPDPISPQMVAQRYFSHFKTMLANCPQIVYDKYFTEEYKQKRFGSLENFLNYVQLNKEEISQLIAKEYTLGSENQKQKYIVQDQYGNTYEFLENYTMEYTAKLDTYTIPSEELTKKYNEAEEQQKVSYNTDKIISMINSRDFYQLYNVLDETFKTTNFPTLQSFEEYLKNYYNDYYTFEITNAITQKDLYVVDVQLSSMKINERTNTIRIIMKLGDNSDFTISFNK